MQTLNSVYHSHTPIISHSRTLSSVYHTHTPTIAHSRTLSNIQNDDSNSNIYTEPTVANSYVPSSNTNHLEQDSNMTQLAGTSRSLHQLENIPNSAHISNAVSSERSHLDFTTRSPFVMTTSNQEMTLSLNNEQLIQDSLSQQSPSHQLVASSGQAFPNQQQQQQQQQQLQQQQQQQQQPPPNHVSILNHQHSNNIAIFSENSNDYPQIAPIQVEVYPQMEIVPEFLPLCDLLFNIISLAGYFCDVVFDGIIAYTLFLNKHIFLMTIAISLILFSGGVSQYLSYRWYKRDRKIQQQLANRQQLAGGYDGPIMSDSISLSIKIMHIFYCGVLWRYFKLFTPVNLCSVKREVRDLCVLRMIHAFCEAAPMLLLQLYSLWRKPSPETITDLNMISIFLSIFSLCWALASFSKNIRTDAIEKLVLTWLGVIFQFLWRFGTITSRMVALTIYQHVYGAWIFAVLILHWFSMLLWLLSPQLVLYFEHSSVQIKQLKKEDKFIRIVGTAWVYCFCFINMENEPPRQRMIAFYVTMFLENILLMTLSIYFDYRPYKIWYKNWIIFLVVGGFIFGLFFLWIYYRFFHIRHLSAQNESHISQIGIDNDNLNIEENINFDQCQISIENDLRDNNNHQMILSMMLKDKFEHKNDNNEHCLNLKYDPLSNIINGTIKQQSSQFEQNIINMNTTTAGVFNCRLNPALKRKKKKPSTVPPPPQTIQQTLSSTIGEHSQIIQQLQQSKKLNKSLSSNSQVFYCNSAANSDFVTKQLCNSGTNTFWRKPALSARSLSSASPSVGGIGNSISAGIQTKSSNHQSTNIDSFCLSSKHPFSSSITSPKPMNFDLNYFDNNNFDNKISRPKPLMVMQNQSIDLDEIGNMLQNSKIQNNRNHTFEYISPEDEDLFTKQGTRPPVPGKEGDNKGNENKKSFDISPESALSRSRLEKILENKRSQFEQFEVESYRSHQTISNETHRSRTTNRSKKYSNGMLRKKRNHASSLRSHLRRKHDIFSNNNNNNNNINSSATGSSSGDEGDIESDNVHTSPLTSPQNKYRNINNSINNNRNNHNSNDNNNKNINNVEDIEDGVDPVILVVKDLIAQTDNSNQQIINYHAAESTQNEEPNTRQLRRIYSAKYIRHNTPL